MAFNWYRRLFLNLVVKHDFPNFQIQHVSSELDPLLSIYGQAKIFCIMFALFYHVKYVLRKITFWLCINNSLSTGVIWKCILAYDLHDKKTRSYVSHFNIYTYRCIAQIWDSLYRCNILILLWYNLLERWNISFANDKIQFWFTQNRRNDKNEINLHIKCSAT